MPIYVAMTVDDLDARDDPKRSDYVATYEMTPEDQATVFAIIKKYKGKYQNTVGFPVQSICIRQGLARDGGPLDAAE